jgi:uncharacterized membrane protein
MLAVHVAAGFLTLFAGAGAIVTKKGGLRHRRLGRTYVYAMAVVSATAVVLLATEQSLGRLFPGLVSVFSFYFAFSGYRVRSRKRAIDRPGTVGWAATGLLGAAGVGLLGMGVWFLLESTNFGVVMLVFGGIAPASAAGDVRQFRTTDPEPRAWFFEGLQRMGGAYIATTTAFVSRVARWPLSAGVGGVAIRCVSRRYERRFGVPGGAEPAD